MAVAPGLAGAAEHGHVVQFYAQDQELAAGAGQYLADALAEGCVVVVVATPAHRQAFESYLAGADADVAGARADGRYRPIDAAALLHRFAVAGEVDAASFEAEVGHVLRAAGAAGRPVRVYGEMVALLWEAGQLNAVLELEGRWNELARDIPFGLYCGYPESPVMGAGQRAVLAEVCRLHEAVVGMPAAMPGRASTRQAGRAGRDRAGPGNDPTEPPEIAGPAGTRLRRAPSRQTMARPGATRSFPLDRDAPRQARHFALEVLRGWRIEQLCGVNVASDVAIVVSELATNAVRHARSGFTVSVILAGDAVRIRVEDAARWPERPGIRRCRSRRTTGWAWSMPSRRAGACSRPTAGKRSGPSCR